MKMLVLSLVRGACFFASSHTGSMLLRRKIAYTLFLPTTVRHRHSASPRPFSEFRYRDRARAIQRAQVVLTDYLHTVRTIPFTFAETISKNSLVSLAEVVRKVKASKKDLPEQLQRFLRYNPVNEFEFFYESIGIDVNEINGFLSKHKFFLSDDSKAFDAACELYRFGFPWNRLGKLYKEERLIFDKDPCELKGILSKLLGYGFHRSSLTGICIVFPHVLRGINSDVDALFSYVRRIVVDFDLVSDVGLNLDDWIDIYRKIRLFYDLGAEKGKMVEMIGRGKHILVDYPEEVLAEKVEYFCRFDVRKEEVGFLLLSKPEIFNFDLKSPKISILAALKLFELGRNNLDLVIEKYPYVLGRNSLANLPHAMRALNLNQWLFDKIKDGGHHLLSGYVIGSYDEDFDKEFADNFISIQSASTFPQNTFSKLKFLHGIGFGENKLTIEVLKQLQGNGRKLQQRFDCLIRNGIEFPKLCKMISSLPKIINQQEERLEKKVKFLFQDTSGFSLQNIDFSRADLCLDTEKRMKRQYIYHTWLTETGVAQRRGKGLTEEGKGILKCFLEFSGYKLLMKEMCEKMAAEGEGLGITRERNKEVVAVYNKLSVKERADLDDRAKEIRMRARLLLGIPLKIPKFRTRCSPNALYQLAAHIYKHPDKRKRVSEMGFGGLMTIQSRILPINFALGLLEKFDTETRTLSVNGKGAFKITGADVCRVLGIPSGRTPMPKLEDVPSQEYHGLLERFPKWTTAVKLRRQIEETKGTSPTFDEAFILYILTMFLCPTSGSKLSPKAFVLGYTASDPTQYNWGDHVLDFFCWGVSKFKKRMKERLEGKKEKQSTTKGLETSRKVIPSCMGCVHFLLLFYIDRERMECEPRLLNDNPNPIGQWTDHDIAERIKKEVQGSKEDHECKEIEDENVQGIE